MPTTMKDIAELCGVSAGAVSQVIRDPENPRFTEATREKILAAAKKLGYRRNPLSCALRTSRTNLVGLILPWNETEVMDHIENLLHASHYKLLLQFTAGPREGMELEALQDLCSWNAAGIIWEPSGRPCPGVLEQLGNPENARRPLVLLERGIEGIRLPVVRTDYTPALTSCISHLKQEGYEQVVLLARSSAARLKNHQQETIEETCRLENLKFGVISVPSGSSLQEQELREARQAMDRGRTAFIGFSWLTVEFFENMETMGFCPPHDYGLVFLQDMIIGGQYLISNFFRPRLTTVYSDSRSLTTSAIQLLLDEIENGPAPAPPEICIPAKFQPGDSTRRLSGK